MTAELREVQRQLARLAQRLAGLVDQGRGDDSIKTDPRPPRPTQAFPDGAALEEAPGEHRVEPRYDDSDGRLSGTVSGQPVEWQLVRYREVSGLMGDHDVEASRHSGDNYVPQPGSWTARPDYVSDFPNIPAELTGSFAGHDAELRGVFHLNGQYGFERCSIVGRIGAVRLEATVQSASGGLCDARTVAVDGTYGTTPFMMYATIDGGLSRGIMHGTIEGTPCTWTSAGRPLRSMVPRDRRPSPVPDRGLMCRAAITDRQSCSPSSWARYSSSFEADLLPVGIPRPTGG